MGRTTNDGHNNGANDLDNSARSWFRVAWNKDRYLSAKITIPVGVLVALATAIIAAFND